MKKQNIQYVFIEIAIVLIGVLIALFIDDWREGMKNKKYVDSIMFAVSEDIKISKKSVQEVYDKHVAITDSVTHYLDDETISLLEIVKKAGGIQYSGVNNISLKFLIANKAELVDYKLISLLASIEETNDILKTKFDKLLDFSYAEMRSKDTQAKSIFIIHLSNVIDSENHLLEQFEFYLNEYEIPTP